MTVVSFSAIVILRGSGNWLLWLQCLRARDDRLGQAASPVVCTCAARLLYHLKGIVRATIGSLGHRVHGNSNNRRKRHRHHRRFCHSPYSLRTLRAGRRQHEWRCWRKQCRKHRQKNRRGYNKFEFIPSSPYQPSSLPFSNIANDTPSVLPCGSPMSEARSSPSPLPLDAEIDCRAVRGRLTGAGWTAPTIQTPTK
jgi:hypothetical protein